MINDHHNDHQMKNIQIESGHITKSILIVIVSMTTREISRTNLRSASIKEIFFFVNCSTLSKDAGIPPAPNFIRIFRIYICICICNCSTLSKHTGIPPDFIKFVCNVVWLFLLLPLQLIFHFSLYLLLLSSYECESNIGESVPTEKITFCSIGKVVNRNNPAKRSFYLLLFQFWLFFVCVNVFLEFFHSEQKPCEFACSQN